MCGYSVQVHSLFSVACLSILTILHGSVFDRTRLALESLSIVKDIDYSDTPDDFMNVAQELWKAIQNTKVG